MVHPLADGILALKNIGQAPYVVFSEGDRTPADLIAYSFGIPKYRISPTVNPEVYDSIVYDKNIVLVGLMAANPYVRKWFPYLTVNYDTETIAGYDEVSEDGKYILKGQSRVVPGKPTTVVILVGGFSSVDTERAVMELISPTPPPAGVWPWPLDAVQAWFESFSNNLTLGQSGLSSIATVIKSMITNDLMPGLGGIQVLIQALAGKIDADVIPGIGGLRDSILAAFGTMGTSISSFFTDLSNTIKPTLDGIVQGIANIPGLISQGLANIPNLLTGIIAAIPNALADAFYMFLKRIFEEYKHSPGIVEDITLWLVGLFSPQFKVVADAIVTERVKILSEWPGILEGFFSWVWTQLGSIIAQMGTWINDAIIKPIHDALAWVWNSVSEGAISVFRGITDGIKGYSERIMRGDIGASFELLASFASAGLGVTGLLSVAGVKIMGSGIEVGELGKFLGDLFNPSMVTGVVIGTALGIGVREPLTQFYNKTFRTMIPDERDARTWLLRGFVNEGYYSDIMARHGFNDGMIKNFSEARWQIPPAPDIITMAVREAFTRPELQAEFPTVFGEWMQKQGYQEIWARYYWAAHWILVPLGQLYDMYHRGLIDEDRLKAMIKYHDYDPEWRDRLISLSWDLPGRIDLRWMFKWGKIDFDELADLLQKTGIDPAWVDKVAEAYAKNQFLVELNKLRDDKKAAFVDGFITESTLKADLEGLGYATDFIAFMVQDAKEDRMLKYKRDLLDLYEDSYLNDIATEPAFEDFVKSVKVDSEAADLFINRAYIKKFRKVKT